VARSGAECPRAARSGPPRVGLVIDGRSEGAVSDAPGSEDPSRPVKLVVWDLDDTLWTGTLSEGPVVLDPVTAEVVRTLNRRGIVNSVCSKNDRAAARAELEEAGLWDEMVFARIDWSPKGARVAQIVEDAQLRAEDVLFIDDLALNREEVRQAVPGIQVAGPGIIDRLLSLPELAGKDDWQLSRLHQYRVLEQRLADRVATPGSNEEFLRSCEIRVGVFTDAESEADRLFELVNRTNQLNFTKRRPAREEFDALLADTRRSSGYVRVRDRYGDYGICGFFSLSPEGRPDDRPLPDGASGDGVLTDFLFSCRILNMGVEQWLYDFLGRPPVTQVGEVASALEGSVDWITRDDALFDAEAARSAGRPGAGTTTGQPDRVLMVGGCDLAAVEQFLGGDIVTAFSHTGPNGSFVYVGHTETIRQSAAGISTEQGRLVDRIPFLDQGVFASPAVVAPRYDVLVLSVLTDYTQGLYRHRDLGLIAPWHQYNLDATDPGTWPWIERRFGREGVDRAFLQWFAEEFEFLGGITVDRFQENIAWLAASIPSGARLVLLNGAEVPIQRPTEPDRHLHHRAMNAALTQVVVELPNASVCDVRAFALGPDDLMSDIRHYRRHVYLQMAEEIRAVGASGLTPERRSLGHRAFTQVWRFAGRRKVELRRIRRRVARGRAGRSAGPGS
jgi:FkbH-like protein